MPEDNFEDAFVSEMGGEEAPAVDDTPAPAPDPVADDPTPAPVADDPAPVDDTPAPEPEAAPAEPQYATREDIRDVLSEYDQSKTARIDELASVRSEIIEKMHPEGLDKNLYDSNDRVINTAQDLVDRELTNPATGDTFSYEEAASWMLNAQQTVNQNMARIEEQADEIATTNMSLKEGSEQVMADWGDLLQSMPDVAKQLSEEYTRTQVVWDEKVGAYTKMNMGPVEFYNLTLAPYKQMADVMSRNAELEEAQKKEAALNSRDERMGLPSRGTSKTKANTGDAMLDALMDEMED